MAKASHLAVLASLDKLDEILSRGGVVHEGGE